jgi:hypothetical protein
VDVDAEYVDRRRILDQAGRSGTGGSGAASGKVKGKNGGFQKTGTSALSRVICPGTDAVPKDVQQALERFLQALVQVTGGRA